MGPVLADIIPLAIGVALSPLPIVAVILILFSQNPRGASLGFLDGWFLGIAVVASVVVFVLACVTVATPVVLALALGEKARPTLNSWKAWLTHNNAVVMMLLCLVFGIMLLSKGLGALIGP